MYNIGDKVWWARCNHEYITKKCPVCFGKKEVTLILGDDTPVKTECDYCGKGYERARGYVKEYEYIAEPKQVIITGRDVRTQETDEQITYYYGSYCLYPNIVFDTYDEALEKCQEIKRELEREQALQGKRSKEISYKSYSWHVGYHRREAKKCREKADWHEARAKDCQELRDKYAKNKK